MGAFAYLGHAGLWLCLLVPLSGAEAQKEPASEPPARRVDRDGDPLPEGAISRFGSRRVRRGGSAFAMAFSPDSKTLGSAGAGGTVRLGELATGQEKHAFTFAGE